MELRLLGPVVVNVIGGPLPMGGPKERAVFTLLAIHFNQAVDEARLIEALWPEHPPRTADKTVQSYVSRLRKALAAVDGSTISIETTPAGYRLNVPPEAIDCVKAEQLGATAKTHLSNSRAEEASSVLNEALSLWDGTPLGELAGEPWAVAEAARLDEFRLRLTELRIEAELALGKHAELLADLEMLCLENPFREGLWSSRMLALYRSRRQAEALDVYRQLSKSLSEELGVDPSPSLQDLERAILRQDRGLDIGDDRTAGEPLLPFPPALAVDVNFVGRSSELETLHDCWSRRVDGTCRAVFIGGEPGIGKSNLVSSFAQHVYSEAANVLFGTCEEDLDVAYQPFTEALRPYVANCDVEVLRRHVRKHGGDIARLVPEIGQRLDDLPSPLSAEPESERFRLFQAVDSLLREAAAYTPVLLVLDDLQWANRPTILLLRHILRQPLTSQLFVIGQYRDTERTAILSDALADLRRQPGVERMTLSGFGVADVVAYLETAGGDQLDEAGHEFAERLHAETNGSPYFVSEVIKHLIETGVVVRHGHEWTPSEPAELFELPASIREVTARRIGRLSETTRTVLKTASVIGPTFDLGLLESIHGDEGEETLDALEEALTAGMITETGTPGSFRFAHELMRRALLDDLSDLRRARVNRLVAEALLAAPAPSNVAEIAIHYLAGAADGATHQAIEYASRAARDAVARVAYEEAVHLYERALEVADWAGLLETALGCDLLLGLANAHWKSGDVLPSREMYGRAAQLAKRMGDGERLARAALRADADLGGFAHSMSTDEGLVTSLEEALAAIEPGDNELRARLLARLAVELFTTPGAHARRTTFADEAVEIAQRLGDKGVLLYTRHCREWATVGPDLAPSTRLERAAAILHLADSLQDLEVSYQARFLRFVTFLEIGDFEGADAEAAEGKRLAERLGSPGFVPWVSAYESLRSWVAGRLEEADELSARALDQALQARVDPQLAFAVIGAQGILIRYLRDTSLVAGILEPMLEQFPNFPTLRVGLALLCLYGNDLEGCRRHYEPAGTNDFLDMPRDGTWLLNMGMAGMCCAALGDERRAEILYPLLLQHSERWVATVVTSIGPMTKVVAGLATTLGWYEAAEIHYERALDQTSSVPAPLFEADTRYDYARMLLKRDGAGDRIRARAHLEQAMRTADEFGLDILKRWTQELTRQFPAG